MPGNKVKKMVEMYVDFHGTGKPQQIKLLLKEGAITIEKVLTEDDLNAFDVVREVYEESKPKCKRCYDRGYTVEGMLNERITCGCSM